MTNPNLIKKHLSCLLLSVTCYIVNADILVIEGQGVNLECDFYILGRSGNLTFIETNTILAKHIMYGDVKIIRLNNFNQLFNALNIAKNNHDFINMSLKEKYVVFLNVKTSGKVYVANAFTFILWNNSFGSQKIDGFYATALDDATVYNVLTKYEILLQEAKKPMIVIDSKWNKETLLAISKLFLLRGFHSPGISVENFKHRNK